MANPEARAGSVGPPGKSKRRPGGRGRKAAEHKPQREVEQLHWPTFPR